MRNLFLSLMLTTALCACSSETGSPNVAKASAKPQENVDGKFASSPPLEIEELGGSATINSDYPGSYVFVHNMNFYSLIDGNINVVDVAAETKEFKGMLNAGQFASFAQSDSRNELYVAESYYSRGTHGVETDVFTIYDSATLNLKEEVVLPGQKRFQSVVQKGSLQLLDNQKYALIFNFTPASSVSVLDLDTREIIQEIPTPGCMLTFPLEGRAFASLCGNGTVSSFQFDGESITQSSSDAFNDIDEDAMFMKSAQIGSVRYFPTFTGNVRPIHIGTQRAEPLAAWSLVTVAERKDNWRPSGWGIVSAQSDGNLYVLMQKNGKEGSHKAGGSEVWVFDVAAKKKIKEIKLPKGGLSIEVTKGPAGHLVATNLEMQLDVFSLDGDLQRTILVNDIATPFVLHAAK